MAINENFTTVTTFSKIIAAVLFVAFPFVGFYLGTQYQKSVNIQTDTPVFSIIKQIAKPTPTTLPLLIQTTRSTTLRISDIEIDFPSTWKIAVVSTNRAKILTDYKPYKVYLTLDLNKNSKITQSDYQSRFGDTLTSSAVVYKVAQGGALAVTGAKISENYYSFLWGVESNQPAPSKLDGIWTPDSNITNEILWNSTLTVRPTKK